MDEKEETEAYNNFIRICECMYTQNKNGDCVCVQCGGDVYACDCELVHSRKCVDCGCS